MSQRIGDSLLFQISAKDEKEKELELLLLLIPDENRDQSSSFLLDKNVQYPCITYRKRAEDIKRENNRRDSKC